MFATVLAGVEQPQVSLCVVLGVLPGASYLATLQALPVRAPVPDDLLQHLL